MIRQQNKGKYIFIVVFSILEILALIGAFSAQYFTKTRMGMLRHVVYLNGKWEKTLPILMIKWIAISMIIILAILAVSRYHKKDENSKLDMVTMLLTIAISGWTVYFLLIQNLVKKRSYYILSICYIVITVLQNLLYHCIYSIKSEK